MKIRARNRVQKQGPAPTALGRLRQLLMPMVAGMAATKKDLMSWVQDVGLEALKEVFEADATAVAGPKGKHSKDRLNHRWGITNTELPFGGRRIGLERPRVRSKSGGRGFDDHAILSTSAGALVCNGRGAGRR